MPFSSTSLPGKSEAEKNERQRYERLRWWSGLTFGDLLDRAADVYPHKEALVEDGDGGGRFTYGELREKVDRLAIGLNDIGIAPTDRVLLQLPNWHEFVVAYFALQKIGAVPVILIARYRQYEINHLVQKSGATAWIVAERYHGTDYLPIIQDVVQENPGLGHIILCRSGQDHGYPRLEALIAKTVLNAETRMRLAALRPDPGATAHMGPTGGTTGVPKIAPHTHNTFLCKAAYSALASEFNQQTICLVVLPAAHDLPFANGICATLCACGKLVLANTTDPSGICRLIEKERVNTVIWVPTLTLRMLCANDTEAYDLSSLSLIYCGGGASTPEMIRGAMEKFGCTYLCGYGGTEGMLVTTRREDEVDTLCCSIGKPTCPYDHYKVVDDADETLPPNQTGHLVVKGPSIFFGYVDMAEENSKAFTEDGYFRTGDLAAIDAAGYIQLAGRVKDTIKRGGESIFAAEIENLIGAHPQVEVVAVIGIPDPEMGERVCAVIQKRPGADLSLDDVTDYLKSRGTSVLQLPEHLRIVAAIPLTPAGKLDKQRLKAGILPTFTSCMPASDTPPEVKEAPC